MTTTGLRYEATKDLPAGVNRKYLKFAGIFIGDEGKVIVALENAVPGPRSKLKNRMIPFLSSPLVSFQHKLCILQSAAGERSLFGFLARGQSNLKEQAPSLGAFWHAGILLTGRGGRATYKQLLRVTSGMQPKGTFHPSHWHPGKHKAQSQLPRHHGLGGYNITGMMPTLVNLHEPAAAQQAAGTCSRRVTLSNGTCERRLD